MPRPAWVDAPHRECRPVKAVRVRRQGAPDVLRVEAMDTPEPGDGEARVRIQASGVNFVDVYYRSGTYDIALPFTPGMEAAGVVDAVGSGVDGIRVGARCAYVAEMGTYAQYAVVPATRLVPVPDDLPASLAAAGLLQGLTAHFLTHDVAPLRAGDTVLVHAAAGGLGRLLVQMLKQRQIRVIGIVSTATKAEAAERAGADDVVVHSQAGFAAEVARITRNEGVAVAFDSVGATTWEGSLRSLRRRGHLVLCGQSGGLVPPVDPQLLRTGGSITLSRPGLSDFIAGRDELCSRSAEVFASILKGELSVHIQDTLALAEAADAHRLLESRATIGKLLLATG